MGRDTLEWSDEKLDSFNIESYWSKKQWGFWEQSDRKVTQLHQGMSFTEACTKAEKYGLTRDCVGIIITLYPALNSC